jgi:hypothetical protein
MLARSFWLDAHRVKLILGRRPGFGPSIPGARPGNFTMVHLVNSVGTPNPIGDVPRALSDTNPNIAAQLTDWRDQRVAAQEDPRDFAALRQHLNRHRRT